MTVVNFEQELRGALARGYCYEVNKDKILDSDLLDAIEIEVMALLSHKVISDR